MQPTALKLEIYKMLMFRLHDNQTLILYFSLKPIFFFFLNVYNTCCFFSDFFFSKGNSIAKKTFEKNKQLSLKEK